jgi:hypothetical protein
MCLVFLIRDSDCREKGAARIMSCSASDGKISEWTCFDWDWFVETIPRPCTHVDSFGSSQSFWARRHFIRLYVCSVRIVRTEVSALLHLCGRVLRCDKQQSQPKSNSRVIRLYRQQMRTFVSFLWRANVIRKANLDHSCCSVSFKFRWYYVAHRNRLLHHCLKDPHCTW